MWRNRIAPAVLAGVVVAGTITACSSSGGGSGEPGIKGHTVSIGINDIVSGPAGIYAANVGKGLVDYLKNTNDHGGVNGYKFDWQSKDNANSSTQGAAVSRQLAPTSFAMYLGGTQAVIGTKPLVNKLKVPMIASATGDLFTPDPNQYLYAASPPYTLSARVAAQFLVSKLGLKNVAIAYQSGIPGSEGLSSYVSSIGGKLVASESIDAATTDFAPFAQQLKSSGAQGIVVIAGAPLQAGLLKATNAISYAPKWAGTWLEADPSYTKLVGSLADGTYLVNYIISQTGNDPAAQEYRKVVGHYSPTIVGSQYTVQGWNLGAIIVEGVKQATAGKKKLTRTGFIDALGKIQKQQLGLISSVTYDSTQHYGAGSVGIFAFQSGGSLKQVTPFQEISTFAKS
jgi:ABC-type branched-subunit amino acid transport system substrate-binding protein